MKIQIVLFYLDELKYGLPLANVERVVPALHVSPLPNAPEIVLGAVNIYGEIIPVVDLRKRFSLPPRDTELSDKLILAITTSRKIAFFADEVEGVSSVDEKNIVMGENVYPSLPSVQGVIGTEDGIVIIHDINLFLSLDEVAVLKLAVERADEV